MPERQDNPMQQVKSDADNPVVRWQFLGHDIVKLFFNAGYTTEGQGASFMLGLGLWLILGGMFTTCPSVYYVMASVAHERLWGVCFISLGLVQVYALFRGGLFVRRYILLFMGALWSMLTVTLLYGDWHAPGVPIYSILAITAFKAFLVHGTARAIRP